MTDSSFWTGGAAGVAQPKRQSRWLLYVGAMPPWVCKKVSKPSFTVMEHSHQFINHMFWYPGKVEWNALEFTVVDPVEPDTTTSFMNIVKNAGYHLPDTQANASFSVTKNNAIKNLGGEVRIQQIGENQADIKETWVLVNPWIQDINFGDLAYESDDLVEITVKLRYDYAKTESTSTAFLPKPTPFVKDLTKPKA